MSPRQIESWKRSEIRDGNPWPIVGPALPPGWLWVFTAQNHQVFLAAAAGKPLLVRRRGVAWVAEVRGHLVRYGVEPTPNTLCTTRVARKGDRPPGTVYRFNTPNDAALGAETIFVEEDDHG